ncbi:MAG: Ger(x)C family spore germination protein [Desulfitobacteriaceae bacterium]|nr:Ger(x)C family spore germination protein [Desulfitobacteriaceae bacterium]MDI6914788.1 Ger(x)C family spore germination protein [Desulfitobacteriaceae bacterium]
MFKKSLLITLILSLLWITGCWSTRELDRLAIVLGTGVDLEKDGQVKLSLQIVKPAEMKVSPEGGIGGPGKPALLLSHQGQTVFDAVRSFIAINSRRMLFSHNQVVIFGESLAKHGIGPVLDFFERDPELREEAFLLIAQGEAQDILAVPDGLEKVSALAFHNALSASDFLSKSMKVTFNDFILAYNNKASAAVAPRIELVKGEGEQSFRIDGMAVFRKDKLAGWLTERETRGLLWVMGKVKSGILVLQDDPGGQDGPISMEIIKAKSKIKADFEEGKPSITVEIEEESNIGEETKPIDLTIPEKIKEIEQKQAALITNEIEAALHKAQILNADIFRFGEELHRADPKAWSEIKDRWEEEFPDLEVQIKVITKVHHIGEKTKPSAPK